MQDFSKFLNDMEPEYPIPADVEERISAEFRSHDNARFRVLMRRTFASDCLSSIVTYDMCLPSFMQVESFVLNVDLVALDADVTDGICRPNSKRGRARFHFSEDLRRLTLAEAKRINKASGQRLVDEDVWAMLMESIARHFIMHRAIRAMQDRAERTAELRAILLNIALGGSYE